MRTVRNLSDINLATILKKTNLDLTNNSKLSTLAPLNTQEICSICRRRKSSVYYLTNILSDSFTNLNNLSNSKYICYDCSLLVNKQAQRITKFIVYHNVNTNLTKVYPGDESPDWWREFLIHPKEGFFTVFSRFKERGFTNYLFYVPLNYSDGNIKDYSVFIAPKAVQIKCDVLNKVYTYFSSKNWKFNSKNKEDWRLVKTNEYLLISAFSDIFGKRRKK